MDVLIDTVFLNNTLLQWISAGVIAALSLIVLWLVQVIIVQRLRRITETTKTQIDSLALDLVANTKLWLIIFVALYLGSLTLFFETDRVPNFLRTLAVIAMLVQGALWGTQVIAFLLRQYVQGEPEDEVSGESAYSLLNFVLQVVLWSVIVLMVLDNIGIQVTSLIAGLGIGSVAIALAVQEILSDIFASLSIVLDKPFVVGDTIEVDQFRGAVEHVGLKTTRVRSITGEELIFANSDLLESRIRNYRRMQQRRVVIMLGVAYETPHETLERIPAMVEAEIEKLDTVRFDRAHLKEMGGSALMYEVVYWALLPDFRTYMDTLQAVNLALLGRFEQEGIDMPYPTQRVYVERTEQPEPDIPV